MKIINQFSNLVDNFFDNKLSVYLIFLVTSMIVLPNIIRESLWVDEIWSATAVKTQSLNLMFSEFILKDVHPPLYHIILYYWERIIGSSDFDLRILSYFFIIISLIASYLLLKKFFTHRIAVLFVVLSAFTPSILYYAQEARMYALLYALANIVSILFFIFIAKLKNNQKIEKKLIITYSIIGVLICYTHFFGYLIIFSLSSVVILYSIILKRNNSTKKLIIHSLLIGFSGILWLIFHFYFGNIGSKTQGNFWIGNDIRSIILNFSTLLAVNKYGVAILIILNIPFLMSFSKLLNSVKKHLILLYPIILLFLTSYLISLNTPIITERNLIVVIPLILLFQSFLFFEFYNDKKIYIVYYLVGLSMLGTYENFTYKKQNFIDASKYIDNNFNCNTCKVPIKSLSENSFDRLMFVSYYLGVEFKYSSNGPEIQDSCNLIYIDCHTNEVDIRNTLAKYNINVPYKILNFNKVYVVIKK